MTLNVKRITTTSILPTRATEGAVGYDLYADEDTVVRAGARAVVSTGISVQVPKGTYGRVAPRSGLAVKSGISVGAGVVDPDYTGELKVVLFNHGDSKFKIQRGFRIAQLVLERCETPEVQEITEVAETGRGSGGFGSTDKAAAEAQKAKKAQEAAEAQEAQEAQEAAEAKKAAEAQEAAEAQAEAKKAAEAQAEAKKATTKKKAATKKKASE